MVRCQTGNCLSGPDGGHRLGCLGAWGSVFIKCSSLSHLLEHRASLTVNKGLKDFGSQCKYQKANAHTHTSFYIYTPSQSTGIP